MAFLSPYMEIVKENWRRGLTAGEEILWFSTLDDPTNHAWGSVASWRHTHVGWNSQHVVSIGSPLASRSVLLSGAAIRCRRALEGTDCFQQNWFRPDNRFANRVFGSLVETIGPEHAAVSTLSYLAVHLPVRAAHDQHIHVRECKNAPCPELLALAANARGRVYASVEELGHDDLLLEALDESYRRVGLRRYRRIWVAHLGKAEEPVAAAVVYRGPLGFNFSFLENRCDIINASALCEDQMGNVAWALLSAASAAYADFLPQTIPTVVDNRLGRCLVNRGANFLRHYSQSLWLKQGYVGWYRHVEKFYERIMHAQKRTGLASHPHKHRVQQPT